MKKLIALLLFAFSIGLSAQCDMEILAFDPETMDISIRVNSGVNCGSPTDSIGEFLLGITTDPPTEFEEFSCFYDNGWALLVFPVNFVLVDINAPGTWLESGDVVNFNIIDAFVTGSDASLCWEEAVNGGFFEDYCWNLAITQINDSHPFPYDNETGLGGFNYPDVDVSNNIISFSPFNPDCNSLDEWEVDPCSDPNVFIANTFTPNGDGLNESFRPIISSPANCWLSWDFKIYNRWGGVVFQTDYPGQQWLGDGGGEKYYAPDGVYTWTLKARHRYGKAYDLHGHVTMFR